MKFTFNVHIYKILRYAASGNNAGILRILGKSRLDVIRARDKVWQQYLETLSIIMAFYHSSQHMRTALHIAAFYGHIEILRLLLENGAGVDYKDIVSLGSWHKFFQIINFRLDIQHLRWLLVKEI